MMSRLMLNLHRTARLPHAAAATSTAAPHDYVMTSGFGFAAAPPTTTDSTELTSMSASHGGSGPGALESGVHSLSAGTTSLALYDSDAASGSDAKGKARAAEG